MNSDDHRGSSPLGSYHCFHFVGEKIEAQNGSAVSKQHSWDSSLFLGLSGAHCYVKLSVGFDAFPLAGIDGTEGRRIPWVPWVESGLGMEDTEQVGPPASEAEFWALHNLAKGFPHLLILGLVPSVLTLIKLFLHYTLGFPDSSVGKESACNAGEPGSIPGSGRSPGEGKGYPLQYSWASLVAQMIKNLPAMWETWV